MIKNVAVLMGGFSSEKDISFKSGEVIFKNIDIFKASDTMVDSLTQLIARKRMKNDN